MIPNPVVQNETLLARARREARETALDWPGTSRAEERRLVREYARSFWSETNSTPRGMQP